MNGTGKWWCDLILLSLVIQPWMILRSPETKTMENSSSAANTTRDGAKSELLAATSSSHAAIATTKQRILHLILMFWSVKASNRLFVQFVTLSKRLLKSAPNAASKWGNTFLIYANSLMMIPQKNNCHDCGFCRAGGRDNFFHCQTCGACYATGLRDNHICIPNSTKGPCLICYEPIYSVEAAQVLRCGHTIHVDCFEQMLQNKGYRCPSCLKSVMNMTNSWTSEDEGNSRIDIANGGS